MRHGDPPPSRSRREALFAPYRALGVVSAGVPLAIRRAGPATFATAATGKAWVVYDCAKLKTVVVGPLVR
jgi:U3 small nucleolar RNA-associated protein 21